MAWRKLELFVLGLVFGVILIMEKLFLGDMLNKLPNAIQRIYTIILIIISWVIFSFDSLTNGLTYLKIMFNPFTTGLFDGQSLYLIFSNIILFIILFFASTSLPKNIWRKVNFKNKYITIENILLMGIFILVIANLVDQSYNPFLYFRF